MTARHVGETEARVRGALLRLWEEAGGDDEMMTASDGFVRHHIERCGTITVQAIQRVGRKVAKGQSQFSIDKGPWCELDDGLEYTYRRGTFTVRRRLTKYPPKLADDSEAMQHLMATGRGQIRSFGFLTVDWTGDLIELRSRPAGEVPKVLREWADKKNAEMTVAHLLERCRQTTVPVPVPESGRPRWLHSDAAARLAVSRDWWRWLGGMLVVDALSNRTRLVDGSIDAQLQYIVGLHGFSWPCLDDPATLGCIELGLLPERHGDGAEVYYDDGGRWWLRRRGRSAVCLGLRDWRVRGEALVAAMEVDP